MQSKVPLAKMLSWGNNIYIKNVNKFYILKNKTGLDETKGRNEGRTATK